MPDTKLSALPAAAALAGSDLVYAVQGGASVRTTVGGLLTAGLAVVVAAGLVGTPGLSFASNPNTGLYAPAVDTLGVVTNSTEDMRFYSDGGVQIGGPYGTSPGAGALHIAGNITALGGTSTTVRTIGFTNVVHHTNRFTIDPAGGAWQSCHNCVNQISSYWTLVLQGARTNTTPTFPAFIDRSNVALIDVGVLVLNTMPSRNALVVTGADLQTAALQQWRNNANTVLGAVYADGGVQIGGTFTASPGAGVLQVVNGIVQMVAAGNAGADGNRLLVGIGNAGNYGSLMFGRGNDSGAASECVLLGRANTSPGDSSVLVGIGNSGGGHQGSIVIGAGITAGAVNQMEMGQNNTGKMTLTSAGLLTVVRLSTANKITAAAAVPASFADLAAVQTYLASILN